MTDRHPATPLPYWGPVWLVSRYDDVHQHRVVPDPGPLITDTAGGADMADIGIRYASAARLINTARAQSR